MRAKVAATGVLAISVSMVCAWPARAEPRLNMAGLAQTAVPQGPWSDGVLVIAPGIAMELALHARPWPLVFGADTGFAFYEWSRHDERLDLSSRGTRIGSLDTTVERRSVMLFGHVFARLQPTARTLRWRPFVEAVFGFKHMRTEVEIFRVGSEDSLASSTPVASTGVSRGLGVGLDRWTLRNTTGGRACWTVGVRYLQGGPMSFPRRGPWPVSPRRTPFDTSRTDIAILYFGLRGEAGKSGRLSRRTARGRCRALGVSAGDAGSRRRGASGSRPTRIR